MTDTRNSVVLDRKLLKPGKSNPIHVIRVRNVIHSVGTQGTNIDSHRVPFLFLQNVSMVEKHLMESR